MSNFFAELKRRHIYRVAAAYAVLAWLLLQIVNNVAPILDLPVWIARSFLLLLVIGFPVVVFFGWMRELPADGTTSATHATRLDYVLAGALVLVIALISYQQFAPRSETRAPEQASSQLGGMMSIAVLPFVNLSDDRAQEFFSDGITEEITAALAKIPSLQVVARTSAFEFKGQNRNIQSISGALHASHVIEGSVRTAGDRVRITAQLIRGDNGAHLWTETYDRELTDIFATQEDIAQAIATALRVPLGLTQGEQLISSRTSKPASYQQYLRARALVRARGQAPLAQATALLEQVIASDRDYAPAWALLGLTYSVRAATQRDAPNVLLSEGEMAARQAIQLAPKLADGYVSLGRILAQRGQLLATEDLYAKALELDPNNPDGLSFYSNLRGAVGRVKDALTMRQQAIALEPFVPVYRGNLSQDLWLNGQDEAAIAMLQRLPLPGDAPTRGGNGIDFARIYASMGRYREAADALAETTAPESAAATELMRTAPAKATSPQSLPNLGRLGFVYLYVGAPERVLEYYEGTVQRGVLVAADNGLLWHPSYAPVRKSERFKTFVRKAGMVEYWRVKGWPEFCRPVGVDDFVCD